MTVNVNVGEWTDLQDGTLTYARLIREKLFAARIRPMDACSLEQLKSMAEQDLERFALEFYFYGCGGPNHVFDGDASDPSAALACTKCGAVKRLNMRYPECLGSVS